MLIMEKQNRKAVGSLKYWALHFQRVPKLEKWRVFLLFYCRKSCFGGNFLTSSGKLL